MPFRKPNLYAMGIRGNPTRTNIAYANTHRSWRVYEDFAQLLIKKVRPLYQSDPSPEATGGGVLGCRQAGSSN